MATLQTSGSGYRQTIMESANGMYPHSFCLSSTFIESTFHNQRLCYVKTFSLNSKSMKSDRIIEVAKPLAALFLAPLHFSMRKNGAWVHEVINGSQGTPLK